MATGPRLHVLHVITHLDLGGAESVALSLVEALGKRADASLFAVLGAGDGPVAQGMAKRLAAAGVAWHKGTALPFKRGGLIQAGVRLAALIGRTRPDLVHLHTEVPEACWAVAARLSSWVRATPVLRTVHNARLWPQWHPIGRWVERSLGDRPAVAVSPAALQGLAELRTASGLRSTPSEGARIILNGVAPATGMRTATPEGAPCRVLFAGRLELQKGADLLPAIWAAARANQAGRSAELTVMGTGSLEPALSAAFAGDHSVRLVPPAAGLTGVLENYDVLLMPSRFEGLPLVAVEAPMAGLPVIGFAAPGLRDIFPVGYTGLAVPEDVPAIARLLTDAIRSPGRFLNAATKRLISDRFSLDRMVADYAALYADLAGA